VLREVIVRLLSRTTREKLLLWKQRSKIRAAIEGDENTRYFHACASQRMRHNKIQVLDHDNMEVFGHEQKAQILFDFYNSLLGASRHTTWSFDLNSLYLNLVAGLSALDEPFTQAEIKTAFFSMHASSSPGPDGFGPAFYKSTWNTTAAAVLSLFQSFHQHSVDLERINRSYIVLLPKKEVARTSADFRPICLQNCPVKGIFQSAH
jgi:hypothetical protein